MTDDDMGKQYLNSPKDKKPASGGAGAGTGTGTGTKNTPEARVRAAVVNWQKAETELGGAIWAVIKACWTARQQGETENSIHTYLVNEVEERFGKGESAANKRGAHISKIKKIAMSAKAEDFPRWEKAGTGFYKAYSEFATPQSNPAAGKKPDTVLVPTSSGTFVANEEQIAAQNAVLSDPDAMAEEAKKGAEQSKAAAQAAEAAKAKVQAASDPTANWATMIEKNNGLWDKLVESLGAGLTIDMVVRMFGIIYLQNQTKARNAICTLMQEETFGGWAVDFYKDNPQLFEEVVDPGVEEQEVAGG